MKLSRTTAALLFVAWLVVVGIMTLSPAGRTPPLTWQTFVCIGCGPRDVADIILNVAMFVPGGMLLARLTNLPRGVMIACSLTVMIELWQVGIAGRSPALQDLVFNTAGFVCGALVVRRGLGAVGRRILTILAVAGWLAPIALLVPTSAPEDIHAMWTPVRQGTRYGGRVLRASVGDVSTPSRRVDRQVEVREAITSGARLDLTVRVGPPPPSFVNLFQLVDSAGAALVTVGAVGFDVLYRRRVWAEALHLDRPDTRWRDAMRSVPPGDTVDLAVTVGREGTCLWRGTVRSCDVSPRLSDGWGHLLNPWTLPGGVRRLLGLFWAAGLGATVGACAGTRRSGVLGSLALAAAGLGLVGLTPHVRGDLLATSLLALSGAVSSAVWVRRTSRPDGGGQG